MNRTEVIVFRVLFTGLYAAVTALACLVIEAPLWLALSLSTVTAILVLRTMALAERHGRNP